MLAGIVPLLNSYCSLLSVVSYSLMTVPFSEATAKRVPSILRAKEAIPDLLT